MDKVKRKYSEALKLKAVYEVETCELSRKGAARRYGCDPASIRGWMRKYGNGGWRKRLAEAAMGDESERIKELERQLKEAKIRENIYERIFRMAKEEMGIDLKKNFNLERSTKKEDQELLAKLAKRGE